MELGRVGVWFSRNRWEGVPVEQVARTAQTLERLGFGTLWMSAGFGDRLPEPFAACLDATAKLAVATGILSVWHVPAARAAAAAATLETAHPGRFVLGLGASHAPLVEREGQRYDRPFSKVSTYLDELDQADPPLPAQRRALAALGPRMLELAATRSAAAHPYFVPVEHTALAKSIIADRCLLAPEQAVVLEAEPSRAREIARQHTRYYLRLANYSGNLRRLGYCDDDLADGGSDRLVDAVVAWGSDEAIAARLREQFDAGADHVCLQVLTPDGGPAPDEAFERLAAIVLT
jgi:probable F420-dependent oxidoreductase